MLVLLGGLTGSGKSTLAKVLESARGVSRLDADEVRKELWGVGHGFRLPVEAYAPGAAIGNAEVFATVLRRAEQLIQFGESVALSATFRNPILREEAGQVAERCGVRCVRVWCKPSLDIQRARLSLRTDDVSDGTLRALEEQLLETGNVTPSGWAVLDTSGTLEDSAAQLFKLIDE